MKNPATAETVNGAPKVDRAWDTICTRDNPSRLKVQALKRFTAQLDALCVRKEDIQRRIADVDARLWEPNWFYSNVYQDEVDDLTDAVRAWRLAAARVIIDLEAADDRRAA